MLWENTDHSASEATLQYTMEPKEFENRFLPYDVLTNLAHVTMLNRQGFLTDDELAELREALSDSVAGQTVLKIEAGVVRASPGVRWLGVVPRSLELYLAEVLGVAAVVPRRECARHPLDGA